MKRTWMVCLLLCGVVGASAQVAPATISVSGSAEVKVAPDEIYLRVGVESRDESLAAAKTQNDEAVAKALVFLKKQVEGKNVQTDFISIEPLYEHSVSRVKPTAYVARNSIEVKLTDVKKFAPVLTGLLTNGVNAVHGIDFRTSELRKHRDQARLMATKAAREKADALAAELGVKRGRPYTVHASDNWWSGAGSYWGGNYGGMAFQNSSQNVSSAGGSGGGDSGRNLVRRADQRLRLGQYLISDRVTTPGHCAAHYSRSVAK